MRLGGPTFRQYSDPDTWVAEVKRLDYGAAYCPVSEEATEEVVASFARAAQEADIVIAEVGAWSNPISRDESDQASALQHCKERLALADQIGARCCVNIPGSRGEKWYGPHSDNYLQETFDLIVDTVRDIIDSVEPSRTFYTLEAMPWIYPDSPDGYIALLKAIDRRQFAVHLDPVNLISSPQRYFSNHTVIEECFEKLGPWVKSCHAKDVALDGEFITHLSEVRPGLGSLDYRCFLTALSVLDDDTPLMLEHLSGEEEYGLAADYIRSVALELGIALKGTSASAGGNADVGPDRAAESGKR